MPANRSALRAFAVPGIIYIIINIYNRKAKKLFL